MKWLLMRLHILMCIIFIMSTPLIQAKTPENQDDLSDEQEESPSEEQNEKSSQIPEEITTLDTDQTEIGTQGNWVKKKDWVMRAYELNNQINNLVVEIQGVRSSFNERYHAIDSELDTFYKENGLDQSKLETLFNSLERFLMKKKKRAVLALDTSEETIKERIKARKIEIIEEQVKAQQKEIEQLNLDMKTVKALDKSLTERLKKMDEQIKISAEIAAQSKKITDKMWYIIDHKKAEVLYYELKGNVLERLQSIQNYLTTDLLQDFDQVLTSIRTQITKSTGSIESLEEKGLFIKDRFERIEQLKLTELENMKATEKAESEEVERQKRQPKKEKQTTWYETMYNSIAGLFKPITNLISGEESSVKVRKKKRKKAAKEQAAVAQKKSVEIDETEEAAEEASAPSAPEPKVASE